MAYSLLPVLPPLNWTSGSNFKGCLQRLYSMSSAGQLLKSRILTPKTSMIGAYIELTKPKQTFLLVLTSVFTYIGFGGSSLIDLVKLLAAMISAVSGATAVNMALDSEIDSIMDRTRMRPIPRGAVSEFEATVFGILLILLGLMFSASINLWVASSTMLGVVFDLLVYTLWAKKRTSLSIVYGSIAGGAPSLAGYAAARGLLDLASLLVVVITAAWIPAHIWYISIYYMEDYRKAKIPMLPVVAGIKKTARIITASIAVMSIAEVLLYVVGGFTPIYLTIALTPTLLLLYKAAIYARNPSVKGARRMYKLASPVEGLVFVAMLADRLLAGVFL
ncbi:MAG: protoheme IX farnesyltransferase [Thermoproteota archaeon]|nr:MAG: protoheme IX farnesyltransferase [Candidatus Korarchaeota archaeon]